MSDESGSKLDFSLTFFDSLVAFISDGDLRKFHFKTVFSLSIFYDLANE
jgi:hypothetical protein